MKTRREFFKSAAAAGFLGATGLPLVAAPEATSKTTEIRDGGDDRRYWVSIAGKLSRPVLEHLAQRELKKAMPVESLPGAGREKFAHLEAFGRLLAGLAPWLAVDNPGPPEEWKLQKEFLKLALASLDAATDPKSPDFMNFSEGGQPLVDAAYLAQGILRAPKILWEPLEPRVKRQIVAALKSSRKIGTPNRNNWVMFAAIVEAALLEFGEPTIEKRLEGCLRKMFGWYAGDGAYGDGEFFHFDYYNSFVIHPMLLDVLAVLQRHDPQFAPALAVVLRRARRFAAVQERLIAPDGTFPSLGRSTTYRFGAFHLLAQIALLRKLPEGLNPAQVRSALTAVIRRMMEAPGTFDENGWLRIGFCGHQPALGEKYISTGSLYLCALGLLPLGLPADDSFWHEPPARWTSQKLWSGESLPADCALGDLETVAVPELDRRAGGVK
jgi:hypothetical protein